MWQAKVQPIPCEHDIGSSWGPSDNMLAEIAALEVTRRGDKESTLPHPELAMSDSDVSDFFDEDSDDLLCEMVEGEDREYEWMESYL